MGSAPPKTRKLRRQGSEEAVFSPVALSFPAPLLALAAARNHSLFVDAGGAVHGCGCNDYGQLASGPGPRASAVLAPQPLLMPKHRKVREADK